MPSEGPNNPGTMADDPAVGNVAWSSVDNAKLSDNNRASASLFLGDQSHYLKATNFSFSVPDVTIQGVEVSIERRSSLGVATDTIVSLVKGGTVSGDNKNAGGTWPLSDTTQTYGGSTDLWGLTLTASDINATDFGVVLSCESTGIMMTETAAVDHITITVTYAFEIFVFDSITVNDDFAVVSTGQQLLGQSETVTVTESVTLAFDHLPVNVSDSITVSEFADNFFNILNVEVVDNIVVVDNETEFAFNPLLIDVWDSASLEEISTISPAAPSIQIVQQRVRARKFRGKSTRIGAQYTGQEIAPAGDAGKLQPIQVVKQTRNRPQRRKSNAVWLESPHTGQAAVVPVFVEPDRLRVKVIRSARQDPRKTRRRRVFQQASGHYMLTGPVLPAFFTGLGGIPSDAKGIDHSVMRGVTRGVLRGVM